MRVLAIRESCENAPEELVRMGYTESSTIVSRFITRGKEYEVHAVVVWTSGHVHFCIVSNPIPHRVRGEFVRITWLPSWFFQVVDPTMPADWECHAFSHPPLIIGPSFISESQDAYVRMVDLERDQSDKFWERLKRIEEQKAE